MPKAMSECMVLWIRDAWAQAVESDIYIIGQGAMCRRVRGRLQYCPLGILCEIAVQTRVIPPGYWTGGPHIVEFAMFDGEQGVLPLSVMRWAGLRRQSPIVYPSIEQRTEWGLPSRYLPTLSQRVLGHLELPPVPLAAINDHGVISPTALAGLIRTL